MTCVRHKKRCDLASFPLINDCVKLAKHFDCVSKECEAENGLDLPAFVDPTSPLEFRPRACLINENNRFFCEGSHPATRRLCPCV